MGLYNPPMERAIGLLEFISIAKGIESADAAIKASRVDLLIARPICPGKYIFVISGEVAAVRNSIDAGKKVGENTVVDELVIPNVHPQIIPAISAIGFVSGLKALGIVETFTCATAIEGADLAAKAAEIDLIELRLAMGIGGKSYFTLTGEVAAVKSSVDAGSRPAIEKGALVRRVVIPSPAETMSRFIL